MTQQQILEFRQNGMLKFWAEMVADLDAETATADDVRQFLEWEESWRNAGIPG